MATWTQGTADEFIAMNKELEKGCVDLAFLGGHTAEINGNRAAQTKMTISQRGDVHGVLCDVVCTGRFYDFLDKRNGRWGMCLRQPIYEKDRIDAVDANAPLTLDQDLLDQFPVGYRHLAYIQTKVGYEVEKNMPGLKDERVEELYATGSDWLAGKSISWSGNTWG